MNETRYASLTNEAEDSAIELLTEQTVPSSPTVSEDAINDIFTVISKPEQRYVLTYLFLSDGEITVTELVDDAVSRTNVSRSKEEFRHRMTVELTNTHLPELVEAGFIEYNMERQLIRTAELTPMVEPYLEFALAQQADIGEQTEE